jgi:hypothetical protein
MQYAVDLAHSRVRGAASPVEVEKPFEVVDSDGQPFRDRLAVEACADHLGDEARIFAAPRVVLLHGAKTARSLAKNVVCTGSSFLRRVRGYSRPLRSSMAPFDIADSSDVAGGAQRPALGQR